MFRFLAELIATGRDIHEFHPKVIFGHYKALKDSAREQNAKNRLQKLKPNVVVDLGPELPKLYGKLFVEQVDGTDLTIFEFLVTPWVVKTLGVIEGEFSLSQKGGHLELRITNTRPKAKGEK